MPEALVAPLPEQPDGSLGTAAADPLLELVEGADVVLLGPGMNDVEASVRLLERVVPVLKSRVVLDALASAFVTVHPDGLRHLGGRCVLTVNPTELARVLDRDEDEVTDDPVGAALDAAERTGWWCSAAAASRRSAHPGATAGWCAPAVRGSACRAPVTSRPAWSPGCWPEAPVPSRRWSGGAYLHGSAGDRLARTVGQVGFLARELLPVVPRLLADLTAVESPLMQG